jgi:hypothetical protein
MRQSFAVDFLQHDDAGLWRITQRAFEHVHLEISQSYEETGFNLCVLEIDVPGNKFNAGRVVGLLVSFATGNVFPNTLPMSIIMYL